MPILSYFQLTASLRLRKTKGSDYLDRALKNPGRKKISVRGGGLLHKLMGDVRI